MDENRLKCVLKDFRDEDCCNIDLSKCESCPGSYFCTCTRSDVAQRRNALWKDKTGGER